MDPTSNDYHSYLLRLWRVRDDGHHWRASLEDVQTGELHGFEHLGGLLDYLEALTTTDQPEKAVLVHHEQPGR